VYKASDICGTAVWAWTRRHVQDVWNNGRKESSDLEAIGKALFRAVTVNSAAAAAAAAAAASTTCSSTMTTLAAGGGVLAATNPQQWTESVRALLQKLPKTAAASLSKERVTAMQNQLSCAVVLHHFVSLYKLWHKQRFIPQSMMFEEEREDEQNMDTSTTEAGSSPSRKQALRKRPASLSTPLIIRQRFLTAFATQTSSASKGRPGGSAEPASSSPGYAMSQVNQEYCLAHILLLYLIAHYKGDAIGADRNSQASASGSSSSSNSTGKRKQRNDESSSSSPTQPLTADHVERLVQDLNVEAVHAMQLLRQAGCTVTRASTSASTKSTMTVTLSTPLTFPQPRRKKASTKR
jgi:A49-like RNA polymerase I associated factor